MTRLKLLIAGLFAMALVTGVLVGMGVSRTARFQDRREWMAEVLNLTPEQKKEMETIWSDDRAHHQSVSERYRQVQKERDDSVQALFTAEQKEKYGLIDVKFKDEMSQLNHERDQAFQAAVESTKAILTDSQRAKYDELMKGGFRGNSHDHGDGWHGSSAHHGGGGAATQKSAAATLPAAGG